jgi:hypothetical protein
VFAFCFHCFLVGANDGLHGYFIHAFWQPLKVNKNKVELRQGQNFAKAGISNSW